MRRSETEDDEGPTPRRNRTMQQLGESQSKMERRSPLPFLKIEKLRTKLSGAEGGIILGRSRDRLTRRCAPTVCPGRAARPLPTLLDNRWNKNEEPLQFPFPAVLVPFRDSRW